jgi:hypothetical protein
MISSLETGAVFKIVDEASPALIKIADSLKELQGSIDKTKESLTALAAHRSARIAIDMISAIKDLPDGEV